MLRQCKACDGTGFRDFYVRDGERRACNWGCLACNGTGQVVERIPAQDAEADMMTWSYTVIESFPSTRYFELFGTDGLWYRVRELHASIERLDHTDTRYAGSLAARAAFRAVPGLRG